MADYDRRPPRHDYDREGRRGPPRDDPMDGSRGGRDPRRDGRDDRYGGGRRDYDRDPRRRDDDRRRYDDDRGGFRDDRYGGGGGRRRDDDFGGGGRDPRRRDDNRGRGREKAGTPERRSPTPPGTVPLSQRRRKASGWDVHAPGYEAYTAMQAKATGYFNLPGANRQHTVAINIPAPVGSAPDPYAAAAMAIPPPSAENLEKQARRLYIAGITPDTTEENLRAFLKSTLPELGVKVEGEDAGLQEIKVNHEKDYAYIDFSNPDDATKTLELDGTVFLGQPLKIRRPKDYLSATDLAVVFGGIVPGVVSTNVPDSINKIFVGGLPTYLNEAQVMELLQTFGELRAFNLVKDGSTGQSKGFAFFEYMDPSITDVACQGLNGMELGDRYLVVQRASIGANPGKPGMPNMPGAPPPPRPAILPVDNSNPPSPILLLLNMVTAEELIKDQDYEDILEDVRDEMGRYGQVVDIKIPRPQKRENRWVPSSDSEPVKSDVELGVGRVYVKFADTASASKALNAVAGRQFSGRSIIATYLQEDPFNE